VGYWTPGDPKQISGVQNAIFEGESLYVLGILFCKRTDIYLSLQVQLLKLTLSSLTFPANVTNLTI